MTEEQRSETPGPQPAPLSAPVPAPPAFGPPASTKLALASAAQDARKRPSYLLLVLVSGISLGVDLGTKWWALHTLEKKLGSGDAYATSKEITPWLSLVLARNRGGAWGLLQTADEHVRRPFFLAISLLAIVFIVSLYRRVHPRQHALKWGLPLVLGGALGNLIDRIRYSWVIDFIDYKAIWVRHINELIARMSSSHAVTDHWPTFNAADIAICVGVGLMAIDMFTSRRIAAPRTLPANAPGAAAASSAAAQPTAPSEAAAPPSSAGPPA